MKKITLIIIIILLVVGTLGFIFRKNLRGILPSVLPPSGDITQIIDNKDKSNTSGEAVPFPLVLPPGFEISIYAKDLSSPRVIQFGPSDKMLVSIPKEGKVVALADEDADGIAEKHITVADKLNSPHGIASRCNGDSCKIYIAETNGVSEYDYDKTTDKATNEKKLFDLPSDGGHSTRTIMFEPYPNEDKMLVSIGSSCNVCDESDPTRAKVMEYDFKNGKLNEFAKGLRNSVFMAIHPVTGEIWATEMGRDNLGDNTPPDEINILKSGGSYGWPVCYGKNIHDTNFDKKTYIRNPCLEPFETASHIDLQAHSAPLGLAFFPEEGWPEEYWHDALVAFHGSWNRTEPTGYKVVRLKLDDQGRHLGTEDFLTGFQSGNSTLGRPVDIIIQPGGTIFVSDDKAGVIYKIFRDLQ